MRHDAAGNPCPATLGEYRDYCATIGGDQCRAVRFLDAKIAVQGRDAVVLQDDAQMQALLWPMMYRVVAGDPFVPTGAPTYRYQDGGTAICCLRCGRVSYNVNDVQHGYCPWCHLFHDDVGIHEAWQDGRLREWLRQRKGGDTA